MVVLVEGVVATGVVVTVVAIMTAHHIEERLKQRFVMNGNKYHRLSAKSFRVKERLARRPPPSRYYCPHGHPLD